MNQPNKERFKTSVGGQALMEGIMMRGPKNICCAVRKPDGTIETKVEPTPTHGVWTKIPLVRGAISMIESLIMGYKYMMYSAQVSMGDDYDPAEEETAFEKWVGDHLGKKAEDIMLAAAAVIGGLFAILLFTVLPTVLVGGLNHLVPLGRWAKVVLEAVLKVAIFLTYMAAISRMKEIHRVFEYHGAEHKTIACYEAGDPLTVENVRKYTRFHPRCGTSFLILVVIVSVFLYSVLPWSSTSLRVVFKLLLLPLVMGISYELLKWCGRSDNIATRIIRQPGIWVQHLTASDKIDLRPLPPVWSSPFPSKRYSPKAISLVQSASVGSQTMLARSFVSSPSGLSGYSLYKNSLEIISSTASPKNSSLSLSECFFKCFSLANELCVSA